METILDYIGAHPLLRSVLVQVAAALICLIIVSMIYYGLRWMWRRSVREFKKGMLSDDEPQLRSVPSPPQEAAMVKKNQEALFVRFCRALGLAIGQTARDWKMSAGSNVSPSGGICPKCGRQYQNTAAKFCTADGTQLVNSNG